ncbi:tyrosine-type recombinase/integrase [Halorarum salinum]|nr:site-specific integrase [Halobaculum salinum]
MDLYLEHRRDEVVAETLRSHEARISKFVEWCDAEGITNINDLDGRTLHAFRVHRREEAGLKPVTLQGQLSTLRQFLRVCAAMDAVPENLHEKILLPTVGKGQGTDDTQLPAGRAKAILEYLGTYEYASVQHVTLLLAWRTSARRGGLRALDLGDFDQEDDALEFRHRPATDTPLKNGEWGERDVALLKGVADVLRDYINGPRHTVQDEHGRAPLITTQRGRPSVSTIQSWVYRVTRPCVIGEPCPHDRDPDTCEAMRSDLASKCPSSRSPHQVRTGSVTTFLDEGTPKAILSDRVDMTEDVMDEHYDQGTKREKMHRRQEYLRGGDGS